jgi:hypothetical protein
VRLAFTAAHTEADIDGLCVALAQRAHFASKAASA